MEMLLGLSCNETDSGECDEHFKFITIHSASEIASEPPSTSPPPITYIIVRSAYGCDRTCVNGDRGC